MRSNDVEDDGNVPASREVELQPQQPFLRLDERAVSPRSIEADLTESDAPFGESLRYDLEKGRYLCAVPMTHGPWVDATRRVHVAVRCDYLIETVLLIRANPWDDETVNTSVSCSRQHIVEIGGKPGIVEMAVRIQHFRRRPGLEAACIYRVG